MLLAVERHFVLRSVCKSGLYTITIFFEYFYRYNISHQNFQSLIKSINQPQKQHDQKIHLHNIGSHPFFKNPNIILKIYKILVGFKTSTHLQPSCSCVLQTFVWATADKIKTSITTGMSNK